jgi:signal transduction histidine kinase
MEMPLSDRHAALVEEAPVGLLLVQTNGTISIINTMALDLLGLPRRVAERACLSELLPNAPASLLQPGSTLVRMALDDRELLLEARPLRGSTKERLITIRDITDQAAIDRIKSTFISDLLHRIRTPLTTIKSGLGLLASGRIDRSTSDAESLLSMSHSETDRLVNVLDDIRDLFLVDTGLLEDEVDLGRIDVSELLTDIRESLLERADSEGLTLGEIQVARPYRVWADKRLLRKVLTKIVENAISYTPTGGLVTLAIEEVGGRVGVTIIDSGPGMSEDEEARAFDRFFRGAASTTHSSDGAGLGLTLARDLVRLLGGEIHLETGAGRGTRVSIVLQVSEGE